MLDFGRIADGFAELLGGSAANAFSVEGLLAGAGLDPEALQGLPIDEVLTALASAGVDTSALTEGQLGELMGALQSDGTSAE